MNNLFLTRKGSLFALIASFLFVVNGCVKEDDPPVINVSQNEICISQKSSAVSVWIDSNAEWKSSTNQEWCRPSVTTGRHSQEINVLVDENTTKFNRTAIITFETKGGNKKTTSVLVSQEGIDVWGKGETN
ncbi:BACON domain-containing protein [Parabacteroides sp. OttesenSCG-928-G06]|nr:BACON domain-containing protein [Parabacteroides sp. OttesenSCG-928-K15]MDL2281742.1 BACON domain-containing protein [Parabacteroides sp. OttesenSCG-928-G06]